MELIILVLVGKNMGLVHVLGNGCFYPKLITRQDSYTLHKKCKIYPDFSLKKTIFPKFDFEISITEKEMVTTLPIFKSLSHEHLTIIATTTSRSRPRSAPEDIRP